MFLFLLTLCLVVLYKVKLIGWNEGYLSFQETTALKGFFIGLVFLSHMQTYLDLSLGGVLDRYALSVINLFGQLMVAYFFFCSGYGVMLSFMTKENYDKGFLRHRILKTLVHFDTAILLYILVSVFLGKQYELKNYLLCWIGWESVGNSNWFIFVTLALYLITWVAFRITNKNSNKFVTIMTVTAICGVLWIVLYYTKSSYWYNTLFCYPAGMIISLYKDRLEHILKHNLYFCVFAVLTIAIFVLTYLVPNELAFSVCAVAFSIVVMIVSTKVEVRSPFLLWMGNHLFEIYILQRIPMILLKHQGVTNHYLFGCISIIATVLLSVGFSLIEKKIDKRLRL